jgi:hypothetical protein
MARVNRDAIGASGVCSLDSYSVPWIVVYARILSTLGIIAYCILGLIEICTFHERIGMNWQGILPPRGSIFSLMDVGQG